MVFVMLREHPKSDDEQLASPDCQINHDYGDPNLDRKFDLVAAAAGPFVKALADLQNRQKRFEENLMNRFEQFCDEPMDFFKLKLKSIKDKMKRYQEMNAWVLSGGAAMQKLDDEEAEEHAA